MSKDQIINGIRMGQCTLVGYLGDFPRESGNCFSIVVSEEKAYRIVNFHAENLRELLERKVIKWPVKIIPISEDEAIICDERIPDNWYLLSERLPLIAQEAGFRTANWGLKQEKEYRIVVICHGKSRDEVEDILGDIHQATMRRDPMDEPVIVIESKDENTDWERDNGSNKI